MRARGALGIELRGVSVRREGKPVLRDVSLRLEPGERWALIGGNGAGKTQLLKLLATDVWPTPRTRAGRVYRLDGRAVDLIEAKLHLSYLGAELQDKYARYDWNLTVADLLTTGLHRSELLLRPATAGEQGRVERMMRRCGLTRLRARRFASLSYGQKRVALLARALLQEPQWLLLDEFYNGLDAQFRRRVDAILAAARRAGRSWIAAAHRPIDVPQGTGGVIELRAGRVVAVERLTARALASSCLARLQSDVVPVRRRVGAARSVRAPRAAGAKPGSPLLQLRDVRLFVEYRCVLRDVQWQLLPGEHWAVFGANGTGKSSFLKLLYGDLSPALGGTIEREGQPRGTPIRSWKRGVGLVSPELQTTYAIEVSVLDLVASGRHASIGLAAPASAEEVREAMRWLAFFGLAGVAARRARELSYGQLRRALFARAMVAEPRVLLLDEPLTGLDPVQQRAMKRLLSRLMRTGVSVVIAVHHAEDLPHGITHALHLRGGRASASAYDTAS